MVGVHLGEAVPALDNPEPTETKLGRAWGSQIDWDHVRDTAAVPSVAEVAPLPKRRLTDETARAPKWLTGTFRVPYGMKQHQFDALCREMFTRWVDSIKVDWDLYSGTSLQIHPGPNPSRDLSTGLVVPGYRDFLLSAQFVERHPEIVHLELPGELFEAWRPSQLPTSSGDDEET